MSDKTAALILAAGQGKRMQSRLPKVLHTCAGLPLVCHAVRAAQARGCSPIVVVVSPSHAEQVEQSVRAALPDAPLRFAQQAEPRGTGDAARAGLAALAGFQGRVYLLYGDAPLLRAETLAELAQVDAPLALLTARVAAPQGYGRILRDPKAHVVAVVEERDCSAAQRDIDEINAGVYLVAADLLGRALAALTPNNAQNELYLTDIVGFAAQASAVAGVVAESADEIRGVNSRAELVAAEAILMRRLLAGHAQAGVTVRDPAGTHIDVQVQLAADVELGVGVQLRGRTQLAQGVRIDGPSVLVDVQVEADAQVLAFSHLERARVGPRAVVGPYARLRPETQLDAGARVGNFVELKKTHLGAGAKVNHLSYLGDADVGAESNVGAGSITCNYDGHAKHRTEIGPRAFVGSHATLVAPIRLGAGAFVAAGSTLTEDVADDGLAFGRARQVNRPQGAKALRERLGALPSAAKKKDI